MMTDLSTLEQGQPCFVEMYGDAYEGTVTRQFHNDRVVQVKTRAARFIMKAWEHMSFRWSDGRADARREDARLIVPTDAEEQAQWEGRAKRTAAGFGQLGLGLEL